MLIDLKFLINKYNIEPKGLSHFGAHVGQEVPIYLELKFKEVYLFEPQSEIFKILEKSFASEENIFLFNFGLGLKNERVSIYADNENSGESASVLEPKKHKILYPDITFDAKEEIELKQYDSLNLNNVNFLVLDIQGYELFALRGSIKSLSKIDYIYTEINRDELYVNNTTINELDSFLKGHDFIRVETRWAKDGYLPWGDAFYINNKKINSAKRIIYLFINIANSTEFYYFYLKIKFLIKSFIRKIIN
jgi:FkbM family methyltransferase